MPAIKNPLVNIPENFVQTVHLDVTFESTTATTIEGFPAGTVFESVTVVTTTAFTGGTGTTLDVGVDGNTDSLVAAEDVRSAGTVDATVIGAGRYLSADDTLTATISTDDTAGAATVIVKFTTI